MKKKIFFSAWQHFVQALGHASFSLLMLELFALLGSALDKIIASLCDLKSRLDSRTCVAPDVFTENMKLREDTHHLGKNIKLLLYLRMPIGEL